MQCNNYARRSFTSAKKKEAEWFQICQKGGRMIFQLLKGRGMVSGLFKKKWNATGLQLQGLISNGAVSVKEKLYA
jgi:hypothetical protein